MRKFYTHIVNNQKKILLIFILMAICGAVLQSFVKVDYDIEDYLPNDVPSSVAIDVMNENFDGGIPNARVMVKNVSIAQALEYKDRLEECEGVDDVLWLDDAVNIYEPLEMADQDTVETYYKDSNALFTVTIEEEKNVATVDRIRDIIGEDNAMTGNAVSTAVATTGTVKEINVIVVFAVLIVILILIITTTSWMEPVVVMAGLGVAIMINSGTNLIFGTISFVTNAAGSILQLAVSLDYSVFLIHRYEECLSENPDRKGAMVDALCKSTSSIASSGLTTVIGFLALLFMRFGIGMDLGRALAKGVAISLITVFIFMPALIMAVYPLIEKTRHKNLMPQFTFLGKAIQHIMIPLVFVFLVVAIPSFLASNSNSYYYGASHIYGSDTKLGQDTDEIIDIFGQSDTYVLLVPNGNNEEQKKLSDELRDIPEVSSIISYVDTVGAEIPKEYLDESTLKQLVSPDYSRFVISIDADYEGKETFKLVEKIRDTANGYYPGKFYLAGQGVSTYDLMDTITADTLKVNLIAIFAVFAVLLITMKSLILPVILVFVIEAAIWINMGIPYFADSIVQYIAYLIISSIQLGATVDYAILFTDRYLENRKSLSKKQSIVETVSSVTTSILTSGTVLAVVGFLLNGFSTHGILKQLGLFLGRGTILSMISVFFVLPGLLYIFDFVIQHAHINLEFRGKGKVKSNEHE
ncbi:MAG: RND family transporter [Lachnospira sp.]